ncbi:hypothetical protein PDIG_22950 [Penicillium digitatum PHI26]|uniref:Uncharacterized protein n=2 Tax=Penicillium digitatum TaxID=36651 RepID=K9G1U4_PEND2|nr:hypothetical protein PDIP_15350 [Penicillium digitatum Pd1]EKV15940.1 hypothetical protein PDIG_22950 [Penicillium digitatum PHI26]EKV20451.1 hypothetical protein PDIP_15350 [Penicillium digitatum Pd1]
MKRIKSGRLPCFAQFYLSSSQLWPSPRSWFPSGLNEGDTVILNEPTTSNWTIDEMVDTHSYQCQDRSLDSYASVLFRCPNTTNGKEAFMRLCFQVPHAGHENADKASRTREATKFTPPELKAYKFLISKRSQNTPTLLAYDIGSQDSLGAVPKGHTYHMDCMGDGSRKTPRRFQICLCVLGYGLR